MQKKTILLFLIVTALISTSTYLSARSKYVKYGDRYFKYRSYHKRKFKLRKKIGGQIVVQRKIPIDWAIEFYRKAISINKNDKEAHYKLLWAQFYKGKFVMKSNKARKRYLGGLKKMIESFIRKFPKCGEIYFWGITIIGEWTMMYGIFAAFKEGIGSLIHKWTKNLMKYSPKYLDYSPYAVVGQAHMQAPYVPLLNTWPDKKYGKKLLKTFYKHSGNKVHSFARFGRYCYWREKYRSSSGINEKIKSLKEIKKVYHIKVNKYERYEAEDIKSIMKKEMKDLGVKLK